MKTIHLMRPRTPEDGNDVVDLYGWSGEKYPLLAGMTWQRVPRRETKARLAQGWLLPGTPIQRPPVDRLGFPLTECDVSALASPAGND